MKPEYGKEYFTIMDVRNVSRLFSDPECDGEPVQIYEPNEENGDDIVTPDKKPQDWDKKSGGTGDGNDDNNGEGIKKHEKYVVNDVEVKVISERVKYYDKDEKLITESLTDY